jgi:quercetin dioxygenase-like cupin family protein
MRGPRSTVVEALGKVWMLTIERRDWRPSGGGERVAAIGPLPINPGAEYTARYMEAIFTPGMTSSIHRHSGPEVWYTLAGETCLETSEGKMVGRPGGSPVIVPGGLPMYLTATGTEKRKAVVLILYDSSKPAATPANDWVPKGLCGKPKFQSSATTRRFAAASRGDVSYWHICDLPPRERRGLRVREKRTQIDVGPKTASDPKQF